MRSTIHLINNRTRLRGTTGGMRVFISIIVWREDIAREWHSIYRKLFQCSIRKVWNGGAQSTVWRSAIAANRNNRYKENYSKRQVESNAFASINGCCERSDSTQAGRSYSSRTGEAIRLTRSARSVAGYRSVNTVMSRSPFINSQINWFVIIVGQPIPP